MKILQITPFYEPHLGGIETHVKALNKELIKCGHEVSVLTQRHDVDLSAQEKKSGVEINRIDTETKYYNKLNYKLTVWRQVARQAQLLLKADVIHVHDVYWWLLPILPLFWSKIYLTFHGWEGEFPVPWRNKLARQVWSRLALKTIHVGDYIKEFYWDQPNTVIYGGVQSKKKIASKKMSQKPQIIFMGRLEPENDIEKYLSLAKKLKSETDVEIVWVGDGAYKDDCQKLGKATGMIKDASLYLAKADLVWSASYLSILESQAQGKIVCALYSHQLKEQYLRSYPGSTNMLIEYDIEQMKTQILKLINSPRVFNQYSHQAQQWSQQQTWKKVADKYQQLWGAR